MPSTSRLTAYGFVGGIRLLLMGWAAQPYTWYGYEWANPSIGAVSTSPGVDVVTSVLFIVGTVLAFVAFSRGLVHTVNAPTSP